MEFSEIIKEIGRLKKERNAVIVAHNYQIDEVQEIADVIGDSFALSRFCAQAKEDVIVFCGVSFMAESAKILAPDKTVLLPEIDAGCPMADMADAEDLRKFKLKYPNAVVVCYVNSTAEVKAESDICCTSSNAVKVVKSVEKKDIIFVPDQNLGNYVAKKVPEKNIILWKGYCPTHHRIELKEVLKIKKLYPYAKLLIHPECRPEVVELADFVGSTSQIINYVKEDKHNEFIIGTEMGVLYKLKNNNPDKRFYLLSPKLFCPNMKKTSLETVLESLKQMKYEINLNEEVRQKAKKALERMLKIQ